MKLFIYGSIWMEREKFLFKKPFNSDLGVCVHMALQFVLLSNIKIIILFRLPVSFSIMFIMCVCEKKWNLNSTSYEYNIWECWTQKKSIYKLYVEFSQVCLCHEISIQNTHTWTQTYYPYSGYFFSIFFTHI